MTEPDSETTGEKKLLHIPIGIDISTWPRCVAVWNGTEVQVLTNAANKNIMKASETFKRPVPKIMKANETLKHPGPSVGAITTSEVSLSPDQQHDMLFEATINNMRRMIGRNGTDPAVKLPENLSFLRHILAMRVQPSITTAEDCLKFYLRQLRKVAETGLQRHVRDVVLTYPVSFNRLQLARLHDVCHMAGLHILLMIPQSTAVAFLYAQQQRQASFQPASSDGKQSLSDTTALIFSMDYGYCDVAVTAATSQGLSKINALAGSAIGGEDIIGNTMRLLLPDFENKFEGGGTNNELMSMSLLRIATLEAIHRLKDEKSVRLDLDLGNGRKIRKVVTRGQFEEVNKEVFETCERLIRRCLRDSKLKPRSIDDVITVGEFGNVLKVKNLVTKIYKAMNPLEAALCGAAMAGAVASGMDKPLDLNLPFTHATTLSLGIRANGNNFVCVIPSNTSIPTMKFMEFTTVYENQTGVLILVYEGEEKKAQENQLLGYLKMTGIPEAAKGIPNILVGFKIDPENKLRVAVRVFVPGSQQPAGPADEIGIPIPHGHFLHYEALNSTYGDTMDLASYSRQEGI